VANAALFLCGSGAGRPQDRQEARTDSFRLAALRQREGANARHGAPLSPWRVFMRRRQVSAAKRALNLSMRSGVVLAAMVAASLSGPAAAQATADRRIVPTEDGFLEIDTQSGNVNECRRAAEGYRCSPARNDQSALQTELERLRKEHAELRGQLAQGAPPIARNQRPPQEPPSDADIDRALDVMEKFLRRFLGVIRDEKPDRT
jgi:hypothetical protein